MKESNDEIEIPVININECQICGDPTDNKELCVGCRLLIEMKIEPKSTNKRTVY